MTLLALLLPPAYADDFLQGDAGAPGMAVQVNVLREGGGFTGGELVTTSCADVVVGPVVALDRSANPSSPVSGAVLQAVFFIDEAATAGQECDVYVDGIALAALSAGVDNRFSIVAALSGPTDGGALDSDGAVDGVITLSSSLRSDGGTLVLADLAIPAGETLWVEDDDPVAATPGNEAYLPLILLVQGEASIDGTLALEGEDGGYATYDPSDGGNGGLGGGGGGVGSNCLGAAALAGDGFTGGGGTALGYCIDFGYGGAGSIEGPDLQHGGEGVFTTIANGAVGYAGGTGGGTGVPWGTGGGGGMCCGVAGAGGYGGGGGNGHSDASYWGAGGGGFGSSGENGIGTLGGSYIDYRTGGAGLASGHATLVPLAGGSGGAGGDSGAGNADGAGGGGGGGGLLLAAAEITFGSKGLILAYGGDGGTTLGVNPGSSVGGGGGSGGGVHLAAAQIAGLTSASVDLNGGYAGSDFYGYYSGDGGEGRLRLDGAAPPTLGAGPTGQAATTWEGASIAAISDTTVTISSAGAATLTIYDESGAEVATLSLAADGSAALYPYLPGEGTYLLALSDAATGVLSPAGAATLAYQPDADGDGYDAPRYGGDDCDDDAPDVNPGETEVCDEVDNDCDGDADEDSSADATAWYADDDGDGYGDAAVALTSCDQPSGYVADSTDCDGTDSAINPGETEICNGVDDDCDGTADEASAADAGTFYADSDGDGYGDLASPTLACDQPAGYVADSADCDDGEPTVYPGGTEVCDALDNDCDGLADEDDPDLVGASTWYLDADGDGYGSIDATWDACDQPSGYVAVADDCDDTNAAFYPGAPEADCADPSDYNCDGAVGYADADGDSFAACEECDDGDALVNPGAAELCNGVDDDCDGAVDDGVLSTFYADADGDGYGDAASPVEGCGEPDGAVADATDCDDADAGVNPGAEEIPGDGIDQDCDSADAEDTGQNLDTGGLAETGEPPPGDTAQGGGAYLGGKDACEGCASGGAGPAGLWGLAAGLLALARRRRG